MALPGDGCRSDHRTADHATCTVEPQPRHYEWVANRTDESERSLRRRSQIHRCIGLIESGLRLVHRWYSGSTKDSCQQKQNQHPRVSLHGHVTPSVGKGIPARIGCQSRRRWCHSTLECARVIHNRNVWVVVSPGRGDAGGAASGYNRVESLERVVFEHGRKITGSAPFSRSLRSGTRDSQQFGSPLFYHRWTVPAVTAPTSWCRYCFSMRRNLKRYYGAGDLLITCSCYRRQPLLGTARRRDLLLTVLEQMRKRYQFVVAGYVVKPEHIHVLISGLARRPSPHRL